MIIVQWLLIGLTSSTASFASDPGPVTEAEMALLPKYCLDVRGYKESRPDNQYDRWIAITGPGFGHMHHYCWALIWLGRAERSYQSAQARKALRENAVGDIYYVIRQVPPDFVMLPEIYTKLGQAQLQLKLVDRANEAFARARSLKPDYWPAYFHWAEYLRRTGQTADARSLVEQGLKHDPDAKPLQQLLKLLGGDPGKSEAGTVRPS